MKLVLGVRSDIKCPECGTAPQLETGFFGSFFAAAFLSRLEEQGGSVTCSYCKCKYKVKGNKD